MYAKKGQPLTPEEHDREAAKIVAAVDGFGSEMKATLIKKLDQGWRGWDDPQNASEIQNIMLTHGMQSPLGRGAEVNVANFAMFLWYQRNHKNVSTQGAGSGDQHDT